MPVASGGSPLPPSTSLSAGLETFDPSVSPLRDWEFLAPGKLPVGHHPSRALLSTESKEGTTNSNSN